MNPGSVAGSFTYFSFSEGDTVHHDRWDVAFRNTTIIINGGFPSDNTQPLRTGNAAVYIIDGIFSEIESVNETLLLQDSENGLAIVDDLGISQLGWSSYNMDTHILSPIPGKVLVFRTHDNKYAKMEILYYYNTPIPNPSAGDYGGYYTFNYTYQPNGSTNF